MLHVLTVGLGVLPSTRQSKPLVAVWHYVTLGQKVVSKLNCDILFKQWFLLQISVIAEHITDQSKVLRGMNIICDGFMHCWRHLAFGCYRD